MVDEKKNKPIFKTRAGNVSVSVFQNTAKKDNKEFFYNSVVLQRSYVKKDGDPKKKEDWVNETINFRPNDLIKFEAVLTALKGELFLNKDLSESE